MVALNNKSDCKIKDNVLAQKCGREPQASSHAFACDGVATGGTDCECSIVWGVPGYHVDKNRNNPLYDEKFTKHAQSILDGTTC
jgi:hypothetical protein